MSSDLFFFDGSSSSLYQNSSPEDILSSDTGFLFGDHELSSIDIFQALSDDNQTTNQQQQQQLNPQTDSLISPPSHEFQTLNLYNNTQTDVPSMFGDFHGLDCFSVKTEECQVGFVNSGFYSQVSPQNLLFGPQNVAKLIQRSFSSNSFEQNPLSEFPFSPRFDSLMESQSFQNQPLTSSENGFLRRVCSTGDLQSFGTVRTTQRSLSSPLASESSLMEEANFKVGKYNAEERKERISKYKAKRTLRNFNKTIKYACRKTLADNRPRIRGRFARNDEPGGFDVPKATSSRPDDDDDLWLEDLHEEEEYTDQTVRAQLVNSYGPTQFQYYTTIAFD